MNISTFGAFTSARLGIYAAQKGLDVTGHNITNINTVGFTRQTLSQVSLRTGGYDRYQSVFDTNVGSGALCTGVTQLRDPYLDIRYRNEQASVGAMDAKLSGLEELSSILDEVGKGDGSGVIEKQFNDLLTQLQNLNTQGAGQQEYDTLVRTSATTLAQLFNSYSSKLDDIEQSQLTNFKQDITTVNNLLENVRDLNASIRRSEIHGDNALELRDQRNLLIDQLSQYVKIDVNYGTEDVGGGQTVEKLTIRLAGGDSKTTLVFGNYAGQLCIRQEPVQNPDYDPLNLESGQYLDKDGTPVNDIAQASLKDNENFLFDFSALTDAQNRVQDGSDTVELGDNALRGALQAEREMLTKKGEFSSTDELAANPSEATKRGIPYYRNALDALARKFANTLNAANTISEDTLYQKHADGNFLTDADGNRIFNDGYEEYNGGALFTGTDGKNIQDITAANFSVSKDWASGKTQILKSKQQSPSSQDNSNIIHIIAQVNGDQEYRPSEIAEDGSSTVYFKGSFQEMLCNISTTLANDKSTTTTMLSNYSTSADELNSSRDSVSGVDLNDEAANMMQYQKSYSAACRLMTTIDEMLDKLINGTGTVGR